MKSRKREKKESKKLCSFWNFFSARTQKLRCLSYAAADDVLYVLTWCSAIFSSHLFFFFFCCCRCMTLGISFNEVQWWKSMCSSTLHSLLASGLVDAQTVATTTVHSHNSADALNNAFVVRALQSAHEEKTNGKKKTVRDETEQRWNWW